MIDILVPVLNTILYVWLFTFNIDGFKNLLAFFVIILMSDFNGINDFFYISSNMNLSVYCYELLLYVV